jgi:uncharacterized heparinase superfamily protein
MQIVGRLKFRLVLPRPELSSPPMLRARIGPYEAPVFRDVSLVSPEKFRFLSREIELPVSGGWDDAQTPKLWRYNLHYFDDLNAVGSDTRAAWHQALIARWIRENPPGQGTGWEPYPTSIRIVNWIKWALRGPQLEADQLRSLANQVRWLIKRVEHHLLGNHLLANAKAMMNLF